MADSQTRAAAFIRGFFKFLESRQHRAAVLHGGDDGFEHEVSDVDFVVDHRTFSQLHALIDTYCGESDWLLCQVLRHETTAAYFVCSAADEPECAVALDACSDYQRNGTVYISAETLLENRRLLPWGGHGISMNHQLLYRFTKAALKQKDPYASAIEFAGYPESARRKCQDWLSERWKITLREWDGAALGAVFRDLRGKSPSHPSIRQPGSFSRIASRILHPSGLIVVTGTENFDTIANRLQQVFGHLYFRRFSKAEKCRISMIREIVTSTIIVIPELTFPWSKLIYPDCLHRMNAGESSSAIATRLHQRCNRRQHL